MAHNRTEVERTLKRAEFRRLVKETHDAIDEYAEGRLSGEDWFGSPGITLRAVVKKLTDFGNELREETPPTKPTTAQVRG